MHRYVMYNGRIVSADESIFKPGQLGLLSGWGVFSTLRIGRGVPFAMERHWARLCRDAELIHVDLPVNLDAVRAGFAELIRHNDAQEAVARICVFRSKGGRWEGPGTGASSDWVVLTDDLSPWPDAASLSVRANARFAASPFVGAKTLSWSANLTMYEDARREGFDEVILLNERSEVTECTSANIFAVRDGITYTPPLHSGLLPGVTREVMLSELRSSPKVQEKVLAVDDLLGAEEVFITSSTRELLPVARIGETRLTPAGEWPVMAQLRRELRDYRDRYTDAQLAGD
ncbi:MAG: aminotransferase class IV [Acidobacteria bacterium]|nr:aminotransferase class IV [Acidobacteriota bacterium]MDA1234220.1 aminotransferase class IV [Acidobacteriota bacterium]